MSVLAVTGLAREARITEGPGVTVIAGGGDADALRARLDAAIASRPGGIISIGIAGALKSGLPAGKVIVATEIVSGSARFLADRRWIEEMALRLADAERGAIAGLDSILATVAAKRALFERTGALAVDMESHVVARVAEAYAIPFAALRVISDAADDALPPAALVAMNGDGSIAVGRVLRAVLADPFQIPGLLRTARDSERAFAALLRCRNLLGLGLACPYLG